MTFDEKQILDLRLERAIDSLDADFFKAQADAEKFYALYSRAREFATLYHERRILLLQAKHELWSIDDKEVF